MNFYQINRLFLRLLGRLYGICDISGFDFSPMEEKAIVLFVVRSERKKEKFLNKSFYKCRDKHLEYIANLLLLPYSLLSSEKLLPFDC